MPKVYAVRKGRRTGIFATWAEAEAQVNGFGAAQFKGFTDHAEAQTYLAGHPSAKAPRAPRAERAPMKRMVEKAAAALPPETLRVYTDGGCIGNHDVKNNIQPAGWGVIVTRFGKALAELRGPVVLDAEAEHFRGAEVTSNNTAELTAVAEALIWLAAEKSHDAACILYDSKYAAITRAAMEPSFERRSAVDRRPLGLHHARHLQGDCEPRARRDVPATAPQRGRAAPWRRIVCARQGPLRRRLQRPRRRPRGARYERAARRGNLRWRRGRRRRGRRPRRGHRVDRGASGGRAALRRGARPQARARADQRERAFGGRRESSLVGGRHRPSLVGGRH